MTARTDRKERLPLSAQTLLRASCSRHRLQMFMIPSSPTPPASFSVPADAGPETGADSIAGLAKRVSAYLARVVGALADFEDRLLTEDGFFAREEHFEAQIDSLRREFEGNKRAAVRLRPVSRHTTPNRSFGLCARPPLGGAAVIPCARRCSSRARTRWAC